jgi:glutamyl/glutaminyl-tRNA synthetase
LSKRHGATSIEEFQKAGYLPEVMLNYLALLGWSTSDSQQLFSPKENFKEMAEKFELERCQRSPAVFDTEKLKWMNGVYIRQLTKDELRDRAWPYLKEAGLVTDSTDEPTKTFVREALALEQEKLVVLSEAPHLIDFLLVKEVVFDPESVEKVLKKEGALAVLEGILLEFEKLDVFTTQNTEAVCRSFAEAKADQRPQPFPHA